jgi:hypothetical protein
MTGVVFAGTPSIMRTAQLLSPLVALTLGSAVALAGGEAQTQNTSKPAAAVEEIWIEPTDLERRDLFRGPKIGPPPPQEKASFAFVKKDKSGRSPGYDVRDANGVVWSVKLGPEAQSEVTSSRILWAIGFHQPPTYHLEEWTLTGAPAPGQGDEDETEFGGRFRPDIPGWTVVDEWKWNDNPHMSWRPHAGLLVAQMFINNWDLKSSNNKLYEITDASAGPRRRYMVRDLGASLGSNEQAKWLRWTGLRGQQGSKNDLAGFLESGFIDHVKNGRVVFEYSGPNKPLLENITTEDVRWTAQLLSRLSDKQWQDAFRAGGYSAADGAQFIARFKERIKDALAVE